MHKKNKGTLALEIACFLLVIAAVVAAFVVLPLLPEIVPIHWNAAGQIDGWGPSWFAAFLIPLIMAVMLLLWVVLPKIDPFKEHWPHFIEHYWAFGLVLQLFFVFLFAIILSPSFGFQFNMAQVFPPAIAVLFIAIGLLLPHLKRNFFIGIRTPWALASDRVWAKTHAFGGKLFIVFGIIMLFSVALPEWAFAVVIGLALLMLAATFVYSYLVFRKIGKRQL